MSLTTMIFQVTIIILYLTSNWFPPLPGTRMTGCNGEQLLYPGYDDDNDDDDGDDDDDDVITQ